MKFFYALSTSFVILISCNQSTTKRTESQGNKPEIKVEIQINDSVNNQTLVDETLALAKASVSGDIAEIESLVEIVLDSSQTKSTRHRAFGQLHENYPNAFKNIKNVRKNADQVEAALIRQAQIKAIKEKISQVNRQKTSVEISK
jgi:hypothetical protein